MCWLVLCAERLSGRRRHHAGTKNCAGDRRAWRAGRGQQIFRFDRSTKYASLSCNALNSGAPGPGGILRLCVVSASVICSNSVPACIGVSIGAGSAASRPGCSSVFKIPVCSTTRVKSAIVFSLMIDGSGSLGCRICGRSRPVRMVRKRAIQSFKRSPQGQANRPTGWAWNTIGHCRSRVLTSQQRVGSEDDSASSATVNGRFENGRNRMAPSAGRHGVPFFDARRSEALSLPTSRYAKSARALQCRNHADALRLVVVRLSRGPDEWWSCFQRRPHAPS
jgi:hypothetical protein